MTLLKREMFATTGELSAASPGSSFDTVEGVLHQRAGGPRLSGGAAASADTHEGANSAYGSFSVDPVNHKRIFVGGWFFIKEVQGTLPLLISVRDQFGNHGPIISIPYGELQGGLLFQPSTTQAAGLDAIHRWVYLAIGVHFLDSGGADVRYYSKFLGQPMQVWHSLDATPTIGGAGSVMLGFWCGGPLVRGRVGAPSVYTFSSDDFSDIVYPTDVLEPETGLTWYVNPVTGNDANDGRLPSTAWKTGAKVTTESTYTGLFTAADYSVGDTLIIDTSGGDLDLDHSTLYFRTQGLNVRAADGQEWIRFKSHHTLSAGNWVPSGTANVFSSTDTEADIVVWEDDKWMNHPTGNTFADVASQLSSTPGSFWTDGSQLYVHPFDSTDPRTDGKRYERSRRFDGVTPIQLGALNMNVQDIYNGKTCVANKDTNSPFGANCVALSGPPGQSVLKHCYLYYGDKHNLSLVQGDYGDDFLIDDVHCEQASPYAGPGGQTLYVSFNHRPEALGIIHRFRNCRATANAGKIGSTEGVTSLAYPLYLTHHLGQVGEPNQFELIEFVDCDFGSGNLQGEGTNNVRLKRTRCNAVGMNTHVVAEESFFSGTNYVNPWNPANSLTERNCVHVITEWGTELRRTTMVGTVDIQGCTFDARAVTHVQPGVPQAALFNREGTLNLTFRNNLVLMPASNVGANVFAGLRSTDTIQMDRNAYVLGGNTLVYGYNNGSTTQNQSFAQWQALGQDANSLNLPSITLNGLLPVPGSPLIDAGQALGPLVDHTGTLFQRRNDIGAYEAPPTTYAAWQAEYFTPAQLANAGVSGPDAMPANDGVSNFMKFASGLGAWEAPPAIPESQSPPFFNTGQRYWNLLYYRNTWVPGLAYTFRYSTALQGWSNATITNDELLSTTNGIETRRVTLQCGTGDQGFVQLQVSH